MAFFKIEVVVESDREENALGQYIEGLLAGAKWHFRTSDLAVYEVHRA